MIKLWALNKEFDITMRTGSKWPELVIWKKDKSWGLVRTLKDVNLIDVMKEVYQVYYDSDFLKRLIND